MSAPSFDNNSNSNNSISSNNDSGGRTPLVDTDVERRIEEELRARTASRAAAFGLMPDAAPGAAAGAASAANPYYAGAAAAAARNNPYGRANYGQVPPGGGPAPPYHAHHPHHQDPPLTAAGLYGRGPHHPHYGYGAPPPPTHMAASAAGADRNPYYAMHHHHPPPHDMYAAAAHHHHAATAAAAAAAAHHQHHQYPHHSPYGYRTAAPAAGAVAARHEQEAMAAMSNHNNNNNNKMNSLSSAAAASSAAAMHQQHHQHLYGAGAGDAKLPPPLPASSLIQKEHYGSSGGSSNNNNNNNELPQEQLSYTTSSTPKASSGGVTLKTSPIEGSGGSGDVVSGEEYYGEVESDLAALQSPHNMDASNSSPKKKTPRKLKTIPADTHMVSKADLNIDRWYSGCVPLGLEDDKYWLSELQVYLRANFAEVFGATDEDIAAPMHGRNKPIGLGQVGVRCIHCKHHSPADRGQQATSYPSLISGIYNSVQQMLRLHLDCCQAMPHGVRNRIEALKASSSSRGGRKQYWIDSAKRIGLVDTIHGIHFGRDPYGPLPPLTGPSVHSKEGRKKKEASKKPSPPPPEEIDDVPPPPVDDRSLVFPEDQNLISDYLYLTLEQMAPCLLTEADRVGCYKGRQVGFPGLACRHCVGQAGCGRYFPASESSLSQTTTSQTIMNHVRNCRRCPIEIRENLEVMKRARMGPDGKRAEKPKHGGRKVFFHRLWCRIQSLPIDEDHVDDGETGKSKKASKKSAKKPKKMMVGDMFDDFSPIAKGHHEEIDSEDEDAVNRKPASRSKKTTTAKKTPVWYDGCVRLTKSDDEKFLSELQCFARSDLVEVFAWRPEDGWQGYTGRKEVAVGQVGIRCVYSKMLPEEERPDGSLVFPEDMDDISVKVSDMLRLYFPSCAIIPDNVRDTLKSLKKGVFKASEESEQYWIDSARDIGLRSNASGWGITFGRDPLLPSPSDELDREVATGVTPNLSLIYLVRNEDRGECTDQTLLMMRQVKVCTFGQRDRNRGGSGARGRDRILHFPGLACKYCAYKSNIGRYFPINAKHLTDSTANALMTHVSTCNRVPEPIKASLAYLGHRAVLQKSDLSGSWKKAFFKKVWDRLHTDREWVTAVEDADTNDEASADEYVEGADERDAEAGVVVGEEDEEAGDNMNALIKAAAIWLTEQDQAGDGGCGRSPGRSRALPGKRAATNTSPGRGGQDSDKTPTGGKRRRVGV